MAFCSLTATKLKYGVADEDEYNMDEKGLMKGIGDNAKVVLDRFDPLAFSKQPGDRSWVSIIECIGATGYLMPPFIIFKGKQIQQSWIDEKIDRRFVVRVSEKGWTDREIALEWIRHFDQYTKPQLRGEYRLLILDGHTSHVSLEFVAYCEANKIIPLCLPPHATHELQPLDVGAFSPLAKAYKVIITAKSLFGAALVDNRNFLLYYQEARNKALNLENLRAAWRSAGLHPFDPVRILCKYRPKTPVTATLQDSQGRTATFEVSSETARQIDSILEGLFDVCTVR